MKVNLTIPEYVDANVGYLKGYCFYFTLVQPAGALKETSLVFVAFYYLSIRCGESRTSYLYPRSY
jgi:hypothetical protein